MIRRLLLLVGSLAFGCKGESPSPAVEALSPSGPAIHFVAGAEVTRVLLPEEVRVLLDGFAPASRITLRASMPGYASRATFRADAEGAVDVAAQEPLEGTYQGADADGLFWSMIATGPLPEPPSAELDVTMQAEVDGEVVATAKLARRAAAEDLQEIEVHDGGLVGLFVAPAAPGSHPALLTFGGSEGGLDSGARNARLYASLGYACLGIAYFNAPGLSAHLEDLPLEYFGKALSWMKQRPEVKADAIGVLGSSRGGELALVLGAHFPELRAVVAQVPSGVVWPSWDPERPWNVAGSWTLGGRELPYVPATDAQPTVEKDADGRAVEHDTPVFLAALAAASPEALDAATTRVEKAQGPVLLLASADDQLWPSCRLAGIAMDRLAASGHAAAFADELVCYPGAGHHLGTPGLPTTAPPVVRSGPMWLAFGGDPRGRAHAARDAFERKRAFLARVLR